MRQEKNSVTVLVIFLALLCLNATGVTANLLAAYDFRTNNSYEQLIGKGDTAWHHIAIVYNGTTKRIYVDGQVENSAAYTSMVSVNNLNVRLGLNQEYTT